jgi:hypothetical protein
VQRTTPSHSNWQTAAGAARNVGAPQAGGYRPVPGQTYSTQSGDRLAVHSDGSGTVHRVVLTPGQPSTVDLSPSDVESLLDQGTSYVPIGPRILTATHSIPVGRHSNPNGDTVDVLPDGTGVLTLVSTGRSTVINEAAVDALVNPTTAVAATHRFAVTGPSPAVRGVPGFAASATTAAAPTTPAPAAAGPTPPPAGGWGPTGQIAPGAVFVNPANGATLTIGPRGGGRMVHPSGQSRNMSSASANSALRKRNTTWQLQTASPSAMVATQAPTPGAAPAAAAAPGPAPAVPAGPVFTPQVGAPASQFTGRLQVGQVFTGRGGRTITVNPNGTLEYQSGPGPTVTKTPAQGARMLGGASWTATSGPDIDTPGVMHKAAVRRAQRTAALPPVGQPVLGGAPPSPVWPTAAQGPTRQENAGALSRGQTIRVGGEDWIVTETHTKGSRTEVWGYRPGVDDPLTIVRQADGSWRQGSKISTGTLVDVVGPVPQKAANVPTGGQARPFDTALGAAQTTSGVGSAHGAGWSTETQQVQASTLKAGDVILLNGRESEGLFVVTGITKDHKGRDSVQGYNGTAAAAAGGAPPASTHLFLAAQRGTPRMTRVVVDGAVPAAPAVPKPIPPKAASSIERNDISDATSQAKIRNIMNGSPPTLGQAAGATAKGDQQAAHLMELRGYNAHPDVVSEAEMDAYVDDGEIEVFRGMVGTSAALDLAEAYRTGKHYPGGDSAAMFGVGAYAAYGVDPNPRGSYSSAYFHGHKDGLDFAQKNYGAGSTGVMLRMTIKADARVAEFDELYTAMRADRDPVVRKMAAMGKRGVGHYAIYKGYDVIRKSGAYRSGKRGNNWQGGFLVILNRSAMRVSDKNYAPDAYVSRAPSGSNPPPVPYSKMRNRMNASSAKHENDVDYKIVGEP